MFINKEFDSTRTDVVHSLSLIHIYDAEIILFSGSELIDETGTCTNTISSTVLYLNGWEVALHIKVKMM